MKQGRAGRDVSESWKRDPIAKAKDLRGVSQIGQSIGNHVTGKSKVLSNTAKSLDGGRGFNSPLGSPGTPGVGGGGRIIHRSGSQGRR